jgi:hypothetical protein
MGTLTLANGEKYEGEFADGMGNGEGEYFFPDGSMYEGEWKDFKYHGRGTMTFADGSKYEGEFRNGKRDGYGKMSFADGEIYVGHWTNDIKQGYGILITADGEKYQGIWNKDKFIRYSDGHIPPEDTYTYYGEEERKNKTEKEADNSSGTAFFINNNGIVVTNHHVVSDCKRLQINNDKIDSEAKVLFADEINDLAIIKSEKSYSNHAPLRGGKGAKIGEDIITVGYPLGTILGDTIKATTGNISSLTGIANDTSIMQITTPIQPGNSGGPVLDMSGNVVGVVSAKINEIAFAKVTGSLPQNINFAIKSLTLQIFLNTHGVDYISQNSDSKLETSDIVEEAQSYTVRVTCYQ